MTAYELLVSAIAESRMCIGDIKPFRKPQSCSKDCAACIRDVLETYVAADNEMERRFNERTVREDRADAD